MINTGVAGSLNADLDIGDILISKDAIHHDVDATVDVYKRQVQNRVNYRLDKRNEDLLKAFLSEGFLLERLKK